MTDSQSIVAGLRRVLGAELAARRREGAFLATRTETIGRTATVGSGAW